jgi:general stress protein YciG
MAEAVPREREATADSPRWIAKQKEIASKGGRAAHAKGTAHEFDSGEAREAGRKGGVAVSRNREHMAAIGRRGGEARGQSRGRGVAPANTGSESSLEGSCQNSRNGPSTSLDRQVAIDRENEGVNADTQGNRGGNTRSAASGGQTAREFERRTAASFGNHQRTRRSPASHPEERSDEGLPQAANAEGDSDSTASLGRIASPLRRSG